MIKSLGRFCLVFSVMLALVCPSAPLFADESFDALVADGLKSYSDGQYDDAIKKFMQARVLDDQPDLLYNIARCYHKKGDCVAAKEHYKRFIAKPGATADRITQTETYITELGECATTGDLALACTPANATVSIDGDAQKGVCGKFEDLKPGQHSLLVVAPGYEALAMTVNVDVNKVTTASANLKRAEGAIDSGSGANWLGWGLVSGGAALVLGGVIVDIVNLDNQSKLETLKKSDPERAEVEDAFERNQTILWVLYGAGAATAITGVVFLITGVGKPSTEAQALGDSGFSWQLAPSFSPDHAGGLFTLTY